MLELLVTALKAAITHGAASTGPRYGHLKPAGSYMQRKGAPVVNSCPGRVHYTSIPHGTQKSTRSSVDMISSAEVTGDGKKFACSEVAGGSSVVHKAITPTT